jgi:hypothetical protein
MIFIGMRVVRKYLEEIGFLPAHLEGEGCVIMKNPLSELLTNRHISRPLVPWQEGLVLGKKGPSGILRFGASSWSELAARRCRKRSTTWSFITPGR